MTRSIIFAGFSQVRDGSLRFRTATVERRVHQLVSLGEHVSMVRLDQPVKSRSQAAKQLLTQSERWIPEAEQLFVRVARDDNPFR